MYEQERRHLKQLADDAERKVDELREEAEHYLLNAEADLIEANDRIAELESQIESRITHWWRRVTRDNAVHPSWICLHPTTGRRIYQGHEGAKG